MDVTAFSEIESDFLARVQKMIWCNLATVDTRGRPRSRLIHPLWEGQQGWAVSRPESFKARHFIKHPYVSLAYIADLAQPLYVDCHVAWETDAGEKQRIWELMATTPPPYGFDPAPMFAGGNASSPAFGLLKLTPWRIQLAEPNLANARVWRSGE